MVVALKYYEVVSVWFPVLINWLRIVPFNLGSLVKSFRLIMIANKIAPSGSSVDRSRDCIRVVSCFDKQVEDRPFDLGSIVTGL